MDNAGDVAFPVRIPDNKPIILTVSVKPFDLRAGHHAVIQILVPVRHNIYSKAGMVLAGAGQGDRGFCFVVRLFLSISLLPVTLDAVVKQVDLFVIAAVGRADDQMIPQLFSVI